MGYYNERQTLLATGTIHNEKFLKRRLESYLEAADSQTMANFCYTQECSMKATNLDPRKTNPNKC